MLGDLVEGARLDAEKRESTLSYDEVSKRARVAPPVKADAALAPREAGYGIIAEIKRASPSKGDLAEIADPVELARLYEAGGARAISVLTEGRRFKGSLDDLQRVAAAVQIPVLRKDFITTRYQVAEARAHGADLVLLIMACLSDEQVKELLEEIHSWGMSALVETHSEEEVRRAVGLGAQIIGINARDLATFELDRSLFGRLRPLIPRGITCVAESAVNTVQDVVSYREHGADLILIGEALVTGDNPQQAVREFSSL